MENETFGANDQGDDVLLEEGEGNFDSASSISRTGDAWDVLLSVSDDDLDDASSGPSTSSDIILIMAAQPQLKFLSPPVFRAERGDELRLIGSVITKRLGPIICVAMVSSGIFWDVACLLLNIC